MADLLRSLTDDQLALLGCLGAVMGAMLLLSLSFHAGKGRSGVRRAEDALDENVEAPRRDQRRAA